MSQLTVTVLQLGLLVLLWLFVLSVVGVLRRDLFGTRVVPRTGGTGRRAGAAPAAASPAPPAPSAAPPAPAPTPPPPPPPPPPTTPRRLVVTEGPLTGTALELARTAVLIGRSPECTLVLDDDYASSRHARLAPQDGGWVIEDLGSTNGTLLARPGPDRHRGAGAGEPVHGAVPVEAGSTVRIGRTTLELQR